jgi:methyl coenzyme M reductase beta subunit
VLQQFESQYEGLSVGDQVGSQDVTTLGQSTTLQQFAGSATLAGTEVDVYLHTAKFDHEGDYIVVVGIYPQQLDSEAQNVVTLLESLEHSGDE